MGSTKGSPPSRSQAGRRIRVQRELWSPLAQVRELARFNRFGIDDDSALEDHQRVFKRWLERPLRRSRVQHGIAANERCVSACREFFPSNVPTRIVASLRPSSMRGSSG